MGANNKNQITGVICATASSNFLPFQVFNLHVYRDLSFQCDKEKTLE